MRVARNWVERNSATNGAFKVVQFNALANTLSTTVSFPFTDPKWLVWENRKDRLLEEIEHANGDLIGLSEIDETTYQDTFLPFFTSKSIESIFLKKPSNQDGCVMAWNSKAFAKKEDLKINYQNSNQVVIVARFCSVSSGNSLVFAVTHLKASLGEENTATRTRQVEELSSKIASFKKDSEPVIICGDFNDTPDSVPITKLRESSLGLKSAYSFYVEGQMDALYTTLKKRKADYVIKRTIDYIWFSGLNLSKLFDIPPLESFPEYTPSCEYPSDHFLIAAEFSLTD